MGEGEEKGERGRGGGNGRGREGEKTEEKKGGVEKTVKKYTKGIKNAVKVITHLIM